MNQTKCTGEQLTVRRHGPCHTDKANPHVTAVRQYSINHDSEKKEVKNSN